MNGTSRGALLATAVAGLFISGYGCKKTGDSTTGGEAAASSAAATAPATGEDKTPCWGINECKGQGACGSQKEGTSCAGNNSCKGKGWIQLSKADCDAKGGRQSE